MMDRAHLEHLYQGEVAAFIAQTPKSRACTQAAEKNWLGGVPMHWMRDWPMPHPLFITSARGVTLTDVDENHYTDFCLGDTGAMFGHAPDAVVRTITSVAADGLTSMLPSDTTLPVGALLSDMFGLPFWQTTITATDANRSVLRWARAITGRSKILVFNGCYHGAVDDVFVQLNDGVLEHRPALIGQVHDMTQHTRMVEFNDLVAVEKALAQGDIAAVLTEPALTNIGMVEPEENFLRNLRTLTRTYGTLLVLDETHTISYGRGGYTAALNLDPDFITMGKPIAGGLPAAVFGFTSTMAEAMQHVQQSRPSGYSGMGTTLSGNALTLAVMRTMLEEVMTADNYAHMTRLATKLKHGLQSAIPSGLAWSVLQVGARVEFVFSNPPPRNGTEAKAAMDPALEAFIHLYLLNRGIIITPFHNMMLISPSTTIDHITGLITAFADCLSELQNTRISSHAA
jgi:glutamate-1-semialdehyde 2,1-aminomutase